MRAQLHKLPLKEDTSFLYKRWDCQYFDKPWHFHEEFELVLIEKSKGTKIIGDSVSLFEDGNLFLIGSNIPHLFRNDESYYLNSSTGASSIFIHFTNDIFGEKFLNLPELKPVRKLLDQSSYGLEIHGKTKKHIVGKLRQMQDEQPTRRLLNLIEILFHLSESKEIKHILPTRFTSNIITNSKDTYRIQKVLEFIMKNYMKDIYVSEVASMLNMSDAAFSRYFKSHTRKTYSDYLTEIRISHAKRLLIEGDENISQIGYLCGFENLSNFYRHFKKITGLVPKDYRKKIIKIVQ